MKIIEGLSSNFAAITTSKFLWLTVIEVFKLK